MATSTRRRTAAPTVTDPATDATTPATLPVAAPVAEAPAAAKKRPARGSIKTATPEAEVPATAAPAADKRPSRPAKAKAKPPAATTAPAADTAAALPAAEAASPSPAAPRAKAKAAATAKAAAPSEPAPAPAPAAPRPPRARKPAPQRAAPAEVEVEAVSANAPAAEAPAAVATAPVDAPADAPVEVPVAAAKPVPETPADADTAVTAESSAEPAPVADTRPAHSRIGLLDGLRRRLQWQAGSSCPTALSDAATALQDRSDGRLRISDAAQLQPLLALAARLGHTLQVDAAVWQHLAALSDLHLRVAHLEAQHPQGLDAWAQTAAEQPEAWRRCQLEGALFAACVGACVLADDAALQPERQLGLAWQLVQQHFGAASLAVLAPQSAWPQWQATLAALGTPAADVRWLDADVPATLADAAAPEVLIADQRSSGARELPALQAGATWLWVLAAPDVLTRQPLAAQDLLTQVDRLRQGAIADWLADGDSAALAPLLMSRRMADVAEQWPAWTHETRPCALTADQLSAHAAGITTLQQRLARWQRSGFVSDADQLALQAQVHALLNLGCDATTAALPDLLREALDTGAQRVIVFGSDAAALAALAAPLQAHGLPVTALPGAGSPRLADAAARAFRDAASPQVLLVADGVPGAEPRIGVHELRPLVIHLDRPWSAATLARRLARVRSGRAQRELPVWQLLAPGSLAARRHALELDTPAAAGSPTASDAGELSSAGVPQWLRGAALQAWLEALLACVSDPAPTATAETPPAAR